MGDRTADEEDEEEEERISRSWEENGVVLQEIEESEESNKDDEGEVSSDSEIITTCFKSRFSNYWFIYLVHWPLFLCLISFYRW